MCVDDTVSAEGRGPPRELYVYVCVGRVCIWMCVYTEIYGYVGVYGCIWVYMYMEVWGYVYRRVYMGTYVCGCVCALGKWSKEGEFSWEGFFSVLVSVLAHKGLKCLPLFPYLSSLGLPPPGSLLGFSSQPSPHTDPAVISFCCPW